MDITILAITIRLSLACLCLPASHPGRLQSQPLTQLQGRLIQAYTTYHGPQFQGRAKNGSELFFIAFRLFCAVAGPDRQIQFKPPA